ncbi:hypothetical protein [Actinacidiphila glaucinigra]|uniref:hypothetical protein n=1 Tax=Actinacidiphila glaucinigra TaxID=235986 RepID=UPI003D8DD02B
MYALTPLAPSTCRYLRVATSSRYTPYVSVNHSDPGSPYTGCRSRPSPSKRTALCSVSVVAAPLPDTV